jgi:hypothetical protein
MPALIEQLLINSITSAVIKALLNCRCSFIIINEHLGDSRWTKIDGFVQIAELLVIGDLAQILKDIMALKKELSSIAETITKDDRRNTLSHSRYLSN